jgi:histidinol-phosphatase
LSTRQRDGAACTVSQVASYDDDLRFAHVLADAADDITTKRFRALDLRVETKPDLTPVSDADRATEDSLRNILRRSRPRDAVLGEESGQTGTGPRRWVLDPIDATKNYVRGVPVWATLIGLMDGDTVVVGVVTAPALGRRWWAGVGGGAWTGRSLTKASRCQVSQVTKLSDASFSYSGIGGWGETGRLDGFLSLSRAVWRTRAFGDFWSHMLVAEGAVDVSAEPEVSLWDLAALQVIVEEAGGRFTSLSGVASPDGGSVVCTNGHLHDEVLAHLGDSSQQSLPRARYVPRWLGHATLMERHFAVTGVPFDNLWPARYGHGLKRFRGASTPRGRPPGGEFPLQPPGRARLVSPAARALRRLVRQFPRPNRARRPLTRVQRPRPRPSAVFFASPPRGLGSNWWAIIGGWATS